MAQTGAAGGAAAALDAVRAYRRTPPPKPPHNPQRPTARSDALPLASTSPGLPLDWCEGVARLATVLAPESITPARWAVLAVTSARLLRDHGAELHAVGWDALDLFGLHEHAPATNPAGWRLAWLLGNAGEVLDVGPEVIGMRRGPDGARLAFRRGGAAARAGAVPAWELDNNGPAAN